LCDVSGAGAHTALRWVSHAGKKETSIN